MIRTSLLCVLLSTSAFAFGQVKDCSPPAADVDMPDGASASRDQMLEAKANVETFVAEGEAYLECVGENIDALRAELEAAMQEHTEGEPKTEQQQAAEDQYREFVQLHDAMVARMQQLATDFNEQLQAFNNAGS